MSPGAGVHLATSSGTITARYRDAVLEKSISPALRQYIREKNDWPSVTMEMINWSAHGKAFRRQLKIRVHLPKLLDECLPTFHQLNKYGGSRRLCPACGTADETRDHIIRCIAPCRLDWRRDFWIAINKFHGEHRTAPLLIHVFRSVMEEWLQADSDVVASPILYLLDARQLITHQNAIG